MHYLKAKYLFINFLLAPEYFVAVDSTVSNIHCKNIDSF